MLDGALTALRSPSSAGVLDAAAGKPCRDEAALAEATNTPVMDFRTVRRAIMFRSFGTGPVGLAILHSDGGRRGTLKRDSQV